MTCPFCIYLTGNIPVLQGGKIFGSHFAFSIDGVPYWTLKAWRNRLVLRPAPYYYCHHHYYYISVWVSISIHWWPLIYAHLEQAYHRVFSPPHDVDIEVTGNQPCIPTSFKRFFSSARLPWACSIQSWTHTGVVIILFRWRTSVSNCC